MRCIQLYVLRKLRHLREYALYTTIRVKEVASFRGARSINGRGAERNARSSSKTSRKKSRCVVYVETRTNS